MTETFHGAAIAEIERLEKQRDELAAALREIATADCTRLDVATLGNIARAALAKAS